MRLAQSLSVALGRLQDRNAGRFVQTPKPVLL
jgi:hypothetical protein